MSVNTSSNGCWHHWHPGGTGRSTSIWAGIHRGSVEPSARRALDLGFLLSFAGILTFPKAVSIREAAAVVPDDRLLAETDSPFLAPVPHRGKRNEPALVRRVIDTLAVVRASTADAIDARITANFLHLTRDT